MRERGSALLVLMLVGGCEVSVEIGEECRRGDPACSDASLPSMSEPTLPAAGEVHIEFLHGGGSSTALSLSCGSCAEVTAHAAGGVAPYTYAWNDGSSENMRTLCPRSSGTYTVAVFDNAPGSDTAPDAVATFELAVGPCTPADTDAAVRVEEEDDAGSQIDAEPPGCEAVDQEALPEDLLTESVEGPPRGCQSEGGFEFVEGVFHRPMRAGSVHSLHATMQSSPWFGRWRMELWGSAGGCDLAEKLGEFSATSELDQTVMLSPSRDHEMLALRAIVEVGRRVSPVIRYELCHLP